PGQLLQSALSALAGNQPLTDITLTGTVRRTTGSNEETGTVSLMALPTGESRIDLSFPSGSRSEVHSNSTNGPIGFWIGPDSLSHAIPQHNALVESGWFAPAFCLSRALSDVSQAFVFVGTESRDGKNVSHISLNRHIQAVNAPTDWTDQHF